MKKNRVFLIVEGQDDGYPHYQSSTLHLSENDPCKETYQNLFVCSPIFSLLEDGYDSLPILKEGLKVGFIMCPNIFPSVQKLINNFSLKNEIWFSLGLANLIVFEDENTPKLIDNVIAFLNNITQITAYEQWTIEAGNKICLNVKNNNLRHKKGVISSKIKFSDKLPLHLKFAISEYILSVDKFLTASNKFTPHYFGKHQETINTSTELVDDLSFLYGDKDFKASDTLLEYLNVSNNEDALSVLQSEIGKKKKENLINDRNGKLIQFNSSMSYIYSQAYSGTFPIFDHIGIVRRHSLLGIGSAIGSLFELLSQIEECLFVLPFEDEHYSIYSQKVDSSSYFDCFNPPSKHQVKFWEDDRVRKICVDPSKNPKTLSSDFFNRLSFYSGRLGFREYDLSATAAMQVLVEATSLQWNVINYTHEIIHNHVRIILNNLITPAPVLRGKKITSFLRNTYCY